VNFYYPKAISRAILADFGVATPKHAAKSLVKYSERHSQLEISSFVIPQVPGSIKRSRPVHGLIESVFKAKKYVLPLAVFHPFMAGGVASIYLAGGRFNPAKNALVFNPAGGLEQPLSAQERRAYQKSLDEMLRTLRDEKPAQEGLSWQQFQERAQPSLDPFGRPVLEADFADKPVALGISRGSFLSSGPPAELQREFLVTRLQAELAEGRVPKTSSITLDEDWQLLQKVIASPREGVTAHAPDGGVNNVGCGFQPSCHVYGVPIHAALAPALKLQDQESPFVAGGEMPDELDTPWFD